MIDQPSISPIEADAPRDELSMRIMEYAMALLALAAAVLIAVN
jgi:hypothetical protein